MAAAVPTDKENPMSAEIFRAESSKPLDDFVASLATAASRRGFFIHNEAKMDMAHTFGQHGFTVAADFDLHMIQICKPENASGSLSRNPERAVLMPKFVVVFSREGKTLIRFLRYSRQMVAALIDDDEFPESLANSFDEIAAMIQEAV
jgi:uncharacterized protein (DUF302 family)